MIRLALGLTLRSGKEAFVRLVITTAAVAIGVGLLLAVFADFHAFQTTSKRPEWEATSAMVGSSASLANVELWNYSETIYKARFIEVLRVAPLGPKAPVPPGIPRLPGAGQLYASPALAGLLATAPRDQLGARFPGRRVGVVGQPALTGPQELVAIVGETAASLEASPDTIRVDTIATAPQSQGTTNIYRLAFGIGTIAVLFPLLILVATATRLSAARREERYAAIRLVGGTPRQINVLASVDAVVGALFGTLLGIALFLVVRPALASIAFSGARFFPDYVTPTIWGYVALLVLVPFAAAVTSLASLRRVQVSPLGVARKVTPTAPGAARLLPLLIGIPLFLVPVVTHVHHPGQMPLRLVWIGLLLIMAGLVLGGPWLTMQGSRALARSSRAGSSLLAARRLADNPKAAFRSVSGLVLAVFVGTGIAVLAPAVNAAQSPTGDASLGRVLRLQYLPPLSAPAAARLTNELQRFHGATVIPVYANPAYVGHELQPPPSPSASAGKGAGSGTGPGTGPGAATGGGNSPYDGVISCTALAHLSILGSCSPGTTTLVDTQNLFTDNPLFIYRSLPLVGSRTPRGPSTLAGIPLGGLLVKTTDPATLERVRTFLTAFDTTASQGGSGDLTAWQMGILEPETFGEAAQIRNNDDNTVERVILALLALTLLVAGCSLAVTVGGSLVERKRPFTLLRVSGTPVSTLRSVVLLEALLPLLAASAIAAVTGMAVARPFVEALIPESAHVAYPGPLYYLTLAAGLLVAVGIILFTLPLLRRVTEPENARFE